MFCTWRCRWRSRAKRVQRDRLSNVFGLRPYLAENTLNYTDHSGDTASKMCVGPHVQYPSLLSHFNQNQKQKNPEILLKMTTQNFAAVGPVGRHAVLSVQRPTDGRAGGRTLRGYQSIFATALRTPLKIPSVPHREHTPSTLQRPTV
jgi:hypothetical protein